MVVQISIVNISLKNMQLLLFMGPACQDLRGAVQGRLLRGYPPQRGFDGRGQPTASPLLTAIMSGGVGISGRELYKYR